MSKLLLSLCIILLLCIGTSARGQTISLKCTPKTYEQQYVDQLLSGHCPGKGMECWDAVRIHMIPQDKILQDNQWISADWDEHGEHIKVVVNKKNRSFVLVVTDERQYSKHVYTTINGTCP